MEDRYYTPTIDEFYEGFEHECLLLNNTWNKEVFNHDLYNDYGYIELSEFIKKEKIRVKYLDKEDIESLGFTKFNLIYNKQENLIAEETDTFSHWYMDFPCENCEDGSTKLVLNLQTQGDEPLVSIFWSYPESRAAHRNIYNNVLVTYTDILSYARIRNKSELIKVLKLLGVWGLKELRDENSNKSKE